MEDVVIPFGGRTGPDMCHGVTQLLGVLQVTNEDFMVNSCPQLARSEEVNTVQVRYVDTPARDTILRVQMFDPRETTMIIMLWRPFGDRSFSMCYPKHPHTR